MTLHQVKMHASRNRYWQAVCSCGWRSEKEARLSKAERAGLEHVREAK